MKKVFALLAIAGFVACNNAENATPAADTTAKVDSPATTTPVDTTKVDSPAVKVDSPAVAPAAH